MKVVSQIILLSTLALSLSVNARSDLSNGFYSRNDNGFHTKGDDGWFFYNETEEEKKKKALLKKAPVAKKEVKKEKPPEKKIVKTPIQAPTPTSPAPLSSKWIKQKLKMYKQRAIDNPTKENVLAYLYVQKAAMDKAQKFSEVMQQVVYTNPDVDELQRSPGSQGYSTMMRDEANKGKDEVIRKLSNEVGIVFFFTSTCSYCLKQAPVLKMFTKLTGINVMPISLDGKALPGGFYPKFKNDSGLSKQLTVKVTPTLYLYKKPNIFAPLSRGIASITSLKDRIIKVAHAKNWITDQDLNKTKEIKVDLIQAKTNPTKMNPTNTKNKINFNDTKQLVNYMKKLHRSQ